MYELAMLEWLVIAIIVTAGISGCVVSKAGAVEAAPTHAVLINTTSKEA